MAFKGNYKMLENEINLWIKRYAQGFCKAASVLLTEKAKTEIERFYGTPESPNYERTGNFKHLYAPYISLNELRGGVQLNSDFVPDYVTTSILNGSTIHPKGTISYENFILGWHGEGIHHNVKITSPSPMEELMRYSSSSELYNFCNREGIINAGKYSYTYMNKKLEE